MQLQLAYTAWSDRGGEVGFGGHGIGSAIAGGGVPLAPNLWLVGDAGVLRYLARGDGEAESTMLVTNAGLRGQIGFNARANWRARASVHTGDGFTTIGVGLELRADLDR